MGKKRNRQLPKKREESDDESENEQTRKKSKAHRDHQESFQNPKLVLPDWSKLKPFKRDFWTGLVGVTEVSEDLKLERKNLGVNVKGNLAGCPPPVHMVNDPNLPSLFQSFFNSEGHSTPTVIQKQAWPSILCGSNVLGVAPTGSGKTLAYTLPIAYLIQQTLKSSPSTKTSGLRKPLSLVLLPTRELVLQVQSVCKALHRIVPELSSGMIYGGQSKEDQLESIVDKGGVYMMIATPGRLIDVLQSTTTPHNSYTSALLAATQYLVIDEVDRMLALGFREQLEQILSVMRPDRQSVFFTATFPHKLREVVDVWAPNYVLIRCQTLNISDTHKQVEDNTKPESEVTGVQETLHQDDEQENTFTTSHSSSHLSSITISPRIKQHIHICAAHKRPRLLLKYVEKINQEEQGKRQRSGIIIFVNTIKTLKFVQQLLTKQNAVENSKPDSFKSKIKGGPANYKLAILHGQLPQQRREDELMNFRSGKVNILLATDVAARGLHIKRIRFVVNYDFPGNIEQYCHRIGRTGRDAGSEELVIGEAYSLFTRNYAPLAKELRTLLIHCQQVVEKNLDALIEEMESKEMTSISLEDEEGGNAQEAAADDDNLEEDQSEVVDENG